MPEHLAPGVYVQEGPFQAPSIAGGGTDAAAFVGPTRKGPTGKTPRLLGSWAEFQRSYGTCADLALAAPEELRRNHVALAARAFFANGGRRLYVARTRPNPARALPSPGDYASALATLQPLEDLSTIAAPGYSLRKAADEPAWAEIQTQLLAFVEQPGTYRFAVLDPPPGLSVEEVRALRARLDSSHAALYYPWLTVTNPLAGTSARQPQTVRQPPSGFLCGIYADSDLQRGVFKAPANLPIQGALGPESVVNLAEQEVLNPEGINCLRAFENRGFLVWGARTLSSDPEWKYLNLRRYFDYLEGSMDRGTRWAVFEDNAEPLWASLRRVLGDFLLGEWQRGALLGSKPEQAYFVKCDRSTMTQNDLDQGRVICLIGVAALRPAEFVIFRIGQQTASPPAP